MASQVARNVYRTRNGVVYAATLEGPFTRRPRTVQSRLLRADTLRRRAFFSDCTTE